MQDAFADKWYAMFVMTGEEDKVKERLLFRLGDKNLNIVVPKRRMRERVKGIWEARVRTLFPGYVLVNGYVDKDDYRLFRDVPGLIRPLKDNSGFIEIYQHEMAVLSRLIFNNEIIGTSSVFIEGGRITVADGPLYGMDGFIESIDKRKGRAKVRLNFIGEGRLVELSVTLLQSA